MGSIPGLSGNIGNFNPTGPVPVSSIVGPGLKNGGLRLDYAPPGTTNASLYGPTQHNGQVLGASTTAANGTAGSGGSGSGVDPSIAAYFDSLTNAANSQLGRLGNQQAIGIGNIQSAYQHSLDQLNGQKSLTDRNYNTTKGQSLQDYVQSRGGIQQNVGQVANGLQRLLGAHGYTGSANTAANYAAALQGAQQNQQVNQTYGRNQQSLDTNYNDYLGQYNNSVGDLGQQLQSQKNQLQSQIDQNKQSLLSQLANISQQRAQATGANAGSIAAAARPYQDQINAIGGQIDQLGANPAFAPQAATYNAPTLDKYTYTPAQAAQLQGAPGAGDTLNPFLSVLLNGQQKQQQQGQNLAGQSTTSFS